MVDNDSDDGSVAMLGRNWPDVLVLENASNMGFSKAVNRGIRATSSELILLLNPDTLPTGEAVDAMVAELRSDRAVVALGPRIVDAEGRPEISWWWHLGPLAEYRLRALRRSSSRRSPAALRRVVRHASRRRDVDWVTGACLLARRSAVMAAGLLDERYFLYFEDVDLCSALRARGGRVRFTPAVEIVHLRGGTVQRMPQLQTRVYRESQLHFYRKHHPGWYPLLRLYLRLAGKLPPAESV